MLPSKRVPTHPGEILTQEFLEPLGITQVALAEHLGIPVQRINELVKGKRGVTPETAWLLSGAFDTSPEFWINLQSNHDLVRARPARMPSLVKIVKGQREAAKRRSRGAGSSEKTARRARSKVPAN